MISPALALIAIALLALAAVCLLTLIAMLNALQVEVGSSRTSGARRRPVGVHRAADDERRRRALEEEKYAVLTGEFSYP